MYFNNKQFIQPNPNNDIRDIETLENKSKKEYANKIVKVYEINTHRKFTVIFRSLFLRLYVPPTTNINLCYLYDLSSICDSKVLLQSNLNNNHYLDRDRKRKKCKLLHEKIRKLIMKNKKSIKDQVYKHHSKKPNF